MSDQPPIQFRFDERKAAEAAAFLIHLHGGEMNYMLLVKLLYAAERESLRRFNRPIVGDKYVAMRHGPVVSRIYDLIKERTMYRAWEMLFDRPSPTTIRLLTDEPSIRALSPADIEMLKSAVAKYPNMDQFAVRDSMHREFREWSDPGDTSIEISVEQILHVIDKSRSEMDRVRELDEEKRYFKRLFGA